MATTNPISPPGATWHLFLILPNLCPPIPSPFASEYLYLCSGNDPVLGDVADTPGDNTGKAMIGQYQNWFRKAYTPGCLLVRSDAPASLREAETLRAFRNVCALSVISHCMARQLAGRAQWVPLYSDFFMFASYVAAKNGWIQNLDGPVGGMDDDLEHFTGQCSGQIGIPDGFSLTVDQVLLKRLLKAWMKHYITEPADPAFVRLFRSLEVAFQAARFPSDGLSSINDIGTRIGLWVSAFEVLLHPGVGKVDKVRVQEAIGGVQLSTVRLTRKRFSVKHRNVDQMVALPARIYDDLYAARNGFMHGNPVEARDLRFGRSIKRARLVDLAPVLYNLALRAFLNPHFPSDEDDDLDDFFLGLRDIEKGLERAIRGPEGWRRRKRAPM